MAPGLSWERTAVRPIVSSLKDVIASLEDKAMQKRSSGLADEAGSLERQAEVLKEKVKAREADPQWHTTVKTVGSKDDPMAYDVLVASVNQVIFESQSRARAALGAGVTPEAVTDFVMRDPAFFKSVSKSVSAWLHAGLVNPEEEMARLYHLGGSELLREAVVEVRRHNEVSSPLA